mgnify:CR=1 FL=1
MKIIGCSYKKLHKMVDKYIIRIYNINEHMNNYSYVYFKINIIKTTNNRSE